jgi:hypothetical protein
MLSNTTLQTVGGGNVAISIVNGSVFVNSAKVITPDVLVANGVVHVIDGYVVIVSFALPSSIYPRLFESTNLTCHIVS